MKYREQVKYLKHNAGSLHFIHYSCESLDDANREISPRITSIAVLHDVSNTMHSFSIHLVAERFHIARGEIENQYDLLEKEMLLEFSEFLQNIGTANFIHWNMGNSVYGFEAISHRLSVLSEFRLPYIADEKKFNLSYLFIQKYGDKYVDHPRMENLIRLNNSDKMENILPGKDEVAAFKDLNLIKMHKSTMYKTYWFREIFHLLLAGKAKVKRRNYLSKLDVALESLAAKVLGFAAVIYSLWQGISEFVF